MDEFLSRIPHRPPFLFVDRVVEETDTLIKTEKQVKAEEPYFRGHFPGRPIMPGVLICEAVFQAGAILMSKTAGEIKGRVPVLTRINNVKLKRAVVPGDLMEIEVNLKEQAGPASQLAGRVTVNSRTVLTVEFSAMLVEETT